MMLQKNCEIVVCVKLLQCIKCDNCEEEYLKPFKVSSVIVHKNSSRVNYRFQTYNNNNKVHNYSSDHHKENCVDRFQPW